MFAKGNRDGDIGLIDLRPGHDTNGPNEIEEDYSMMR